MEAKCGNIAVRGPAEFRSFAVEAFVGRRATGWPLARFDISNSDYGSAYRSVVHNAIAASRRYPSWRT
jgi:hypothetical protein